MNTLSEHGRDPRSAIDLRLWQRLLGYTLRYRRTTVTFTLVAVGAAVTDIGFPLLTGKVIETIQAGAGVSELAPYIAVFVALTATICMFLWGFIQCAGRIRTCVSHDIRADAFEKLQQLSFRFFDTNSVGWLMARLTSDCQRLSNILAWGVMDAVWGTALMLGISVAMLWTNWRLAIPVFAILPILFGVSVFFRRRILNASRLVRKTNSRLTAAYNEAISGVRTTKVFAREEANAIQFDELADEMERHSVRNAILSAIYLPVVLSLGSIAVSLALSQGGWLVSRGGVGVGEIVMFMYFTQLFFQPIQDLSAWFAELQMAQASAERVLRLIDSVPDIIDRPNAVARRGEERNARIGAIEFRDVGFQYGDGPAVISGLNLTIREGATIALVGPTGGGKSTIANLLCRFYEPSSGAILIDGVDYRDRSLAWLQSQLGIVLQQPYLFSGSIRDNIRYGMLDATDEQIEEAARVAGAHEFICRTRDRYATKVGEAGSQLSMGERQLVSFARAILKGPNLLVMDEATSSIDSKTEHLIQRGMEHLTRDRTSVVIAHRLSTIRSADLIVVVDQGAIVESGTHCELLQERGDYYRLYRDQALSLAS